MLRTLRQPRYAALGALMVLVAIVCVGAGTWQIARFQQKVHENDALRANAHAPAAQVADVLPLVGTGRAPSTDGVEYRSVRVTGTYDEADQTLVRSRAIGDTTGFLVLTPLRTSGATVLVVRGFLPQPASGRIPTAPSPPTGTVAVTARAHPPESRHDVAAQLTNHQVESINPGEQAARLGVPMYNGFVELESHQPGTSGLATISAPDLSNPAGGALEPQHFAYVIQWYLFAILALSAPYAMARAETRQQKPGQLDDEPAAGPTHVETAAPEDLRAAKLADRYGRVR